MEQLTTAMVEYKNITKQLISCLSKDDFDSLDYLFKKRGKVIDLINTINYTQTEFQMICTKLEILPLQKELEKLTSAKRTELLNKLNQVSIGKNVNSIYNKKLYVDSIFLNKKI